MTSTAEPVVRDRVALDPPVDSGTPTRKAHCAMTLMQQSSPRPRRLRAALIGFGFDNADDQSRLTRGDQSLIFGGSAETHAEMQQTALRMELELDEAGQRPGRPGPGRARGTGRRSSIRPSSTKSPSGSRPGWSEKGGRSRT